MHAASRHVRLEVEQVLDETRHSFLLLLPGGRRIYLPKSHVHRPEKVRVAQAKVAILVTEWIAKTKSLFAR